MMKRLQLCLLLILLLPLVLSCSESPEARKAKHLERGDNYFAEQKYKEAIIEYKNVIQIEGGNLRALRGRGWPTMPLGNCRRRFPFWPRPAISTRRTRKCA